MYQPFEPEINWSRFSLTLPQVDIPQLHEHLENVSDTQFASMQVSAESLESVLMCL